MIAYEDLVTSLAQWRAAQGLPTQAGEFLSQDIPIPAPFVSAEQPEEGEVDVEAIESSEYVAIEDGDDAGATQLSYQAEEELPTEHQEVDPYAQTSALDPADIQGDGETMVASAIDSEGLQYGEEETQYSEMPAPLPDADEDLPISEAPQGFDAEEATAFGEPPQVAMEATEYDAAEPYQADEMAHDAEEQLETSPEGFEVVEEEATTIGEAPEDPSKME